MRSAAERESKEGGEDGDEGRGALQIRDEDTKKSKPEIITPTSSCNVRLKRDENRRTDRQERERHRSIP